jgi:nitroimidazol reductase NimA-like FMN-containing flavoprotein (pyridoxamine 5'-phosphate oxidase superfamily)
MRTLLIDDREKIDTVIRSCKTCYLAVCEHDQPYIIPMNFALDGECIILHSAQEGRKWETMKKNPHVCVTWVSGEELAWQDISVGCSYRVVSKSVIAEGDVEFVEEFDEKVSCMEKLMAQYSSITFKFSRPSICNVGVIKVHIRKITARDFGTKSGAFRKKPMD